MVEQCDWGYVGYVDAAADAPTITQTSLIHTNQYDDKQADLLRSRCRNVMAVKVCDGKGSMHAGGWLSPEDYANMHDGGFGFETSGDNVDAHNLFCSHQLKETDVTFVQDVYSDLYKDGDTASDCYHKVECALQKASSDAKEHEGEDHDACHDPDAVVETQ